jgi:hypothetical protein
MVRSAICFIISKIAFFGDYFFIWFDFSNKQRLYLERALAMWSLYWWISLLWSLGKVKCSRAWREVLFGWWKLVRMRWGRACGTHGGGGKCMLGFGGETRKKETAWKTRRSWENDLRRAYIIARSCNHCWHGKVIKITYFECVSLALVIQHAKLSSVVCRTVSCLSTLSHKRHDFRGKKNWTNCLCWFSLQLLSEIFLTRRIIKRHIIINVYKVSTWNAVIIFRFL